MLGNPLQPILILAVGRELSALNLLRSIACAKCWRMESVESGWRALERIQFGCPPDLLVLDLPPGDTESLQTLGWLRKLRPNLSIISIACSADSEQSRAATQLGARECVTRPLEFEALETAISRNVTPQETVERSEMIRESIEWLAEDVFFVTASAVMRKHRCHAELLAQIDMPVLIAGESGSGREITARLIHKFSKRSQGKFVVIDCAAVPGDVLEGELFGFEPGTANVSGPPRPGKLELCHDGTIFLESIAEMPLALQAKLLQVVQKKQFSRVGSDQAIEVDVRILAASDTGANRVVAQKKLREDLYYRLSAFTVHVPSLRQRNEEIPILLNCYMSQMAEQYGLPPRNFSLAVVRACQNYSWPGNLRELENFVRRYLVIGDEQVALEEIVPEQTNSGTTHFAEVLTSHVPVDGSIPGSPSLKSLVEAVKGEAERNAIVAALDQTHWNRKAAARLLKVSYRTLLYKIEQYRMSPSSNLSITGAERRWKGNGHT